jgi:hypothetical protein
MMMRMPNASDGSWSHLAQFIRQHTHDVRNQLNGLDLEAALLGDLVPSGEAAESVARIRAQIRRAGQELRALAAKFAEPLPTPALYATRELFLIWQDQLAALDPAPVVEWRDTLGSEQVNVDAAMLAEVFRELLANAQAFGTGAPLHAAARVEDGHIVFELREPQPASIETAMLGPRALCLHAPRPPRPRPVVGAARRRGEWRRTGPAFRDGDDGTRHVAAAAGLSIAREKTRAQPRRRRRVGRADS